MHDVVECTASNVQTGGCCRSSKGEVSDTFWQDELRRGQRRFINVHQDKAAAAIQLDQGSIQMIPQHNFVK